MKSYGRIIVLIIIIAMLSIPASLFGRGQKEANGKIEVVEEVLVEPSRISFMDHRGKLIEMDAVPKRIASVAMPAGSLVVTLAHDGETLVATSPKSFVAMKEGVLMDFYPGLNNVTPNLMSEDDTPNIEELLNLEPDVVLQWARKTKSIDAMEAAGLKVVGLKYEKINMPQTWLTTLGLMMDQSDKVKEILDWHKSSFEYLIGKTSKIPDSEKLTVLYLPAPRRAAGMLSHIQFFIDTAGAKNAMTGEMAFINIDPEMILKANPDIIWLAGFNMKLFPETIYNDPVYSEVNAVKNRRVYKVPVGGARWDPPNQERPLANEWYTRTVSPDLLDGSIRDHIRTAYNMLYDKIPTEEQLDKMLHMEVNGGARDYGKISR